MNFLLFGIVIFVIFIKFGFAKMFFNPDQESDIIRDYKIIQLIQQRYHHLHIQPNFRFLCENMTIYDIYFLLYTRINSNPFLMTVMDTSTSLEESTYIPENPTKILIHGWNENGDTFAQELKNAYLNKSDVNVIIVDYGEFSMCDYYYLANIGIAKVAEALEILLYELFSYGTSSADVNFIGNSLGAHIAAITNYNLGDLKVPMIIGLDPAGPGFRFKKHNKRLDMSDAEFVMVVHSNGGFTGIETPIGHADFYPNGGRIQPGCEIWDIKCHHDRSVQYFTESLYTKSKSILGFYAKKCDNYDNYLSGNCSNNEQIIMSEETPKWSRGKYFFRSRTMRPFSLGDEQ